MHDIGNGNINYQQLLHQTYEEALMRNEHAQNYWQKLREEYESLELLLNDLPKELSKDVMVPVAPRALMRGKIAHTNEILVCLGQGYFVRRSAIQAVQICKRREKSMVWLDLISYDVMFCADMLESLEKERKLFIERQKLPLQEDAFGGGKEIIEEYNEEEEAHWKAEHKKKEQEYRQKLAELRAKEKVTVVDEGSLWQRLDELELQEELEEELDRLYAEDSDLEEEEEEGGREINEEEMQPGDLPREKVQATHPPLSRRVSFALEEDEEEEENNADEELRIEFLHSNVTPSDPEGLESLGSPAELYTHFKNQFLAEPKSILKKTSSYDNSLRNVCSENFQDEVTEYGTAIDLSASHLPLPVLEEVVERDTRVGVSTVAADRPVSRFKALRQQKRL